MRKENKKNLTDKVDVIGREFQAVLLKHGVADVGMNITFFQAECPGGYLESYSIYNEKTKQHETKYRWVCPEE